MAFGQKAQELAAKQKKREESQDGERKVFVPAWVPLGGDGGTLSRLIRWLPEVAGNELVYGDRLSASTGMPLREGNKKNGKVLRGALPASEVVFRSAIWKVNVGGNKVARRIMLDPDNWNNPLRKFIDEQGYDKDSMEAKSIKLQFAANVYDMSPVIVTEDGKYFYANSKGKFVVLAGWPNGQIVTDKEQLPSEGVEAQPVNKISIIEGSYGKPGGKHFFEEFRILDGTEDTNEIPRFLSEFDIKITVSGAGKETRRQARATAKFSDPDPKVAMLPRYDLEAWTKPWPDEMLERLLWDEEDLNELVEEYNITLFPQLTMNGAPVADEENPEDQEELFT